MMTSSFATPPKPTKSDPAGEWIETPNTDPNGSSGAVVVAIDKKQPDRDGILSAGEVVPAPQDPMDQSPLALPVAVTSGPSVDAAADAAVAAAATTISPTGAADSPSDAKQVAEKVLLPSATEETPSPVRSRVLGKKRSRDEMTLSSGNDVVGEKDDDDDDDDDDEFSDGASKKPLLSSARSSRGSSKRSSKRSSDSKNLIAKLLDANEWWKPSRGEREILDERLAKLRSTDKPEDKALQMMLWDIGFEYSLLGHQFAAVRFVAGLLPDFPISNNAGEKLLQRNEAGASARLETVAAAAEEFARWHDAQEQGILRRRAAKDKTSESEPYDYILTTPGMLLADEMGLGKTIEALAGAALRNAMVRYSNLLGRSPSGSPSLLPTLIVSPQDGIQNQWYESLVRSGVPPSRITVFGDTKTQVKQRRDKCKPSLGGRRKQGGSFVLCTRYKIQSELKKLFACHESATARNKKARLSGNQNKQWRATAAKHRSGIDLFPHISQDLIRQLRNQYQADKGKEKNLYRNEGEMGADCATRLVRQGRYRHVRNQAQKRHPQKFAFQTIVVDEAHFCKNVLAFWGLGLALLGSQSKRTVLLTGTPYNNGPADMSALMTYIDPSHPAARIRWWDRAVEETSGHTKNSEEMIRAVREWREAFMMRRTKDVLEEKLPPRFKTETNVGAHPSELWIYEAYEGKFLLALNRLQQHMNDEGMEARHKRKKVFEVLMACMACMRMSLIHPALPGGREATIHFSPSRRHLLKREERPTRCVLCNSAPTKVAEQVAAAAAARNDPEGRGKPSHRKAYFDEEEELMALAGSARSEMDLDDDELNDDDEEFDAKSKRERQLEEKRKGPIVPLEADLCQTSDSECQHFAHEKCIEKFRNEFGPAASCPKCHDLQNRMRLNLSHHEYCEEITTHIRGAPGGFLSSTKVEEAIKWYLTVPKNEKAIILSFFKGSLDLMEGILTTKYGIECARYDGDVDKDVRTRDLERFKTKSSCRVLLATVQSGGTGLNITEANHVCFLDRWFNPCVHDQAESRCHRIGQEKKVKITYFDANHTVDVVMKRVNRLKEGNAKIILADGTSLGDQWSLGYQNMSGVIGNTLKALQMMREELVKKKGDARLPPHEETELQQKIEDMLKGKLHPEMDDESEGKDDDDNRYLIGEPKPDGLSPYTLGEYLHMHLKRPNETLQELLSRLSKEEKDGEKKWLPSLDLAAMNHSERKPSSHMVTAEAKPKDISSLKPTATNHLERKPLSTETAEATPKAIFSCNPTAIDPTTINYLGRKSLPHMGPHMGPYMGPHMETVEAEPNENRSLKPTAVHHSLLQPLSDDDDSDDDCILLPNPIIASIKSETK